MTCYLYLIKLNTECVTFLGGFVNCWKTDTYLSPNTSKINLSVYNSIFSYYLIIIIMQTYLKVLSGKFCLVCLRSSRLPQQLSQLSVVTYMGLCVFCLPILLWWLRVYMYFFLSSSSPNRKYDTFAVFRFSSRKKMVCSHWGWVDRTTHHHTGSVRYILLLGLCITQHEDLRKYPS